MFRSKFVGALTGLSLLAGCGEGEGGFPVPGEAVGQGLSWEVFRAQVYQEPDTGIFIVDGDVPVLSEALLREFYEDHVRSGRLTVHQVGGLDAKWSDTQKRDLTYCVSTTFGSRYDRVVQAMASAAATWEAASDVKFRHVSTEDARCDALNDDVVFDVNPVNAGGAYFARAFFPSHARAVRNLLFDNSAFGGLGPWTLEGVTRHELGHVLGFRHEHTRTQASGCFEDNNWRALTTYDRASVMHYPHCNGTQMGDLVLTQRDIDGARALYGFVYVTETLSGSTWEPGIVHYSPFSVAPGSTFDVEMTGTGDPDLYVRFGAPPTMDAWDCRPYEYSANERCTLVVPAGVNTAYVMIPGYGGDPSFHLNIRYVPLTGFITGPRWAQWSTYVAQGTYRDFGTYDVKPGTQFRVDMRGLGAETDDPDLYVRFGAPPTFDTYDCRPYVVGPHETCDLTVPAGQSKAYVMVHGYSGAMIDVDIDYTAP
ncbi:Bacterial leucyl aminopeptidase [Myxococcus hansupus]|uniref:Bacterial leucyl aminopeptidase n=1 Tax=Pseudomyxococcus hansupus TaxID=1297742 RepID=A0A0H4X0N7_9BACT|nr:pre-peptidase C-terminal domain-containing protein [Myxococcus hansupus]AKQ69276.1 Bacterial leucyl aminopeptidase [Myxococcus hansupus]